MGKGIAFGFLVCALVAVVAWLVVRWTAFIAKMALAYGDWVGWVLLLGPFALFLIAFFAWIGHRENW